jgi:SAM-dependent methyltransferase
MSTAAHWEAIFAQHGDDELSWFQEEPTMSLELIEATSADRSAPIIDIGSGTSRLAGRLLDDGYEDVTVLEIASEAVERSEGRLGDRRGMVRWILGDVTELDDIGRFDLWHDRAVFHFLVEPQDRLRYVALARRSIVAGGHLVIGTFAPDGPTHCSGLQVRRYDARRLAAEFGEGFVLDAERTDTHITPAGVRQPFVWAVLERLCSS